MMTVRQLIEKLNEFDPDRPIVFGCSIESGRCISWVSEGDVSIKRDDDYSYQVSENFNPDNYKGDGVFDEEEGIMSLGRVLLFRIDGEVTNFQ